MKSLLSLLLAITITACAGGKERKYTGSTPGRASAVRAFLDIPSADSVDFIRWWLTIDDNTYKLECNYGVGKPNTSGFYNGGKTARISGTLEKEKNYYSLRNGNKTLRLLELNDNLLHLLDADNSLLVGGSGWSYTLCNEKPATSDEVTLISHKTVLPDSLLFHGRTPCTGIDHRPECRRLEWSIALFADTRSNQPTQYRLRGTIIENGSKTGVWKIIFGKNGRVTYEL